MKTSITPIHRETKPLMLGTPPSTASFALPLDADLDHEARLGGVQLDQVYEAQLGDEHEAPSATGIAQSSVFEG